MTKGTSFRLSSQTKRQLEELAALYHTKTAALTVAVDRLYNSERSTMHTQDKMSVTAAQLIGGYVGPEWLVEPIGDPSDQDDLDAINASEVYVMERNVRGWGEYNSIIRVPNESVPALGTYYLARLA